ncbi:hypothetical protein LguiB_027587 [Lonicera macranthoides]
MFANVVLKADGIQSRNTKNWSESPHHFLNQCVIADNVEASYTLGMLNWAYTTACFNCVMP